MPKMTDSKNRQIVKTLLHVKIYNSAATKSESLTCLRYPLPRAISVSNLLLSTKSRKHTSVLSETSTDNLLGHEHSLLLLTGIKNEKKEVFKIKLSNTIIDPKKNKE